MPRFDGPEAINRHKSSRNAHFFVQIVFFDPRRFISMDGRAAACNLQLCFGRARVSKTWHEFGRRIKFRSNGERAFRKFTM